MSLEINEDMLAAWKKNNPTLRLRRVTEVPENVAFRIAKCKTATVTLTGRDLHATTTGWISAVWGREPRTYQNFLEPARGKENRLIMPVPLRQSGTHWIEVEFVVEERSK